MSTQRMTDAARVINAVRGLGRVRSEMTAAKLTEEEQAELMQRYEARKAVNEWLSSILEAKRSAPVAAEPQVDEDLDDTDVIELDEDD